MDQTVAMSNVCCAMQQFDIQRNGKDRRVLHGLTVCGHKDKETIDHQPSLRSLDRGLNSQGSHMQCNVSKRHLLVAQARSFKLSTFRARYEPN